MPPTITAKNNECVNPRWPNMSSYRMPSEKPITSMSGNIEQTTVHAQNRAGRSRRHCAAAVAAIAWLKIVGMSA
jgi:hypothetical protein